jgi:hypothetical protein
MRKFIITVFDGNSELGFICHGANPNDAFNGLLKGIKWNDLFTFTIKGVN